MRIRYFPTSGVGPAEPTIEPELYPPSGTPAQLQSPSRRSAAGAQGGEHRDWVSARRQQDLLPAQQPGEDPLDTYVECYVWLPLDASGLEDPALALVFAVTSGAVQRELAGILGPDPPGSLLMGFVSTPAYVRRSELLGRIQAAGGAPLGVGVGDPPPTPEPPAPTPEPGPGRVEPVGAWGELVCSGLGSALALGLAVGLAGAISLAGT